MTGHIFPAASTSGQHLDELLRGILFVLLVWNLVPPP